VADLVVAELVEITVVALVVVVARANATRSTPPSTSSLARPAAPP
jgi:hypothetical protein